MDINKISGVGSFLWGYILTGFLTVVSFLLPIKGFLLAVGLMVLLDTIVGIYTTIKLNGRKSYQSTKLFNFVVKSFFYGSTICIMYVIDYYLIGVGGFFGISLISSKITSIIFIYIELKSIDESSQKLDNPPFYVMIKNLFTKLKSLKKDLNEILDFDKKE